jgi:hypothetical protein
MRHPTDGILRRLVDEPAGVADADREHVAGCATCLTGLAAAREDAMLTGAALTCEVTVDVDEGWRRLSAAVTAGQPARATAVRGNRWRTALRSPVIAVAGVLVLLTGASAAAAADWLKIFHAERVAPVTVTQADLIKIPDLSAYGKVEITQRADIRDVADAAAARKATGLASPRVDRLPRGVIGEPKYQVGNRIAATFTFSTARAAQTAAQAGKPLPAPPAGLEGSQFRMTAGPGVAAIWTEARGVPALVVARAVAPTGYSAGVPFATARDYLLSLPGLPEAVASQLRTFTGDGTTLPLIVKSDRQVTTTADVGGVPATVLATKDGVMAAVIWVADGEVSVVGGSMSADEVLSVARGVRWDR